MTRDQLNTSIDDNVTNRTEENRSSAPLIGGEIKKVADYVDERIAVEVVLNVSRDSGGTYTVTNVKNTTGITFTAADVSTNATGITASASFFTANKVYSPPQIIHNSGVPYICYDAAGTTTLRAVYFFNVSSDASSRPASFSIMVKYTVYP